MRRGLQVFGWLIVGLAALWFFGPREDVPELGTHTLAGDLEATAARFAAEEAALGDVTEGVEKRIIFAGEPVKTDWAVVYVHGFSATSQEIRPVPDKVAEALGANLFYARLTGHGRPGEALGEARVADWMDDMAEIAAVGRALGDKVLMMSASTGGTLSALAAAGDPSIADAFVMVSPNFELAVAGRQLLTFPFARHFVPALMGAQREWEASNADHAKYWTNSYPTKAVMPMAAAAKASREADYARQTAPALVILSEEDQVVLATTTREVMATWGAPVEIEALTMGDGDDPFSHVIAGDIMSPGQTDKVVAKILSWLEQ